MRTPLRRTLAPCFSALILGGLGPLGCGDAPSKTQQDAPIGAAGASEDPNCPDSSECVRGLGTADAGASPGVCANAVLEHDEQCDDGNQTPGDGCNESCTVEADYGCTEMPGETSVCGLLPPAPVIDGESSAGHTDVTWIWDQVETADYFEIVVDAGEPMRMSLDTLSFDATLEDGTHTFEVRACTGVGICSSTTFETTVEMFGERYSLPWQGVAKADLATSPLGNVVPLSCHNCYSGRPGNVVLSAEDALAKIGRALERNVDLVEIDFADVSGTLYASHEDEASAGSHPTLQALLDNEALANSEALLFMEIKESDQDPAEFARELLKLLDANRIYVRNGRPLFLRHFQRGLDYLLAVKAELPNYPMIAHYVRFSVLYPAQSNVATLQQDIKADAADNDLWGIELEYRNPNSMGAIRYAQSLGLAAGLYTIPGPGFGEVYLGALREEVDELTTEYRVDQARAIVEAPTAAGRVDASTLEADVAAVSHNVGDRVTESRNLAESSTASAYGSPAFLRNGAGEDLFGGIFDFRSSQGINQRALELFDIDANAGEGYLVHLVVNFDTLSLSSGQTMALLNKAEGGGFAVELANTGSGTQLRFGVHTGAGYVYHSYAVGGQNQSGACRGAEGGYFTAALNGTDSYTITGAYDGGGGVYLFINNRCAGSTAPSTTGGVTANAVPVLLGADPQPSAATSAQYYFDGLLQSASVVLWGDHSGDGVNE